MEVEYRRDLHHNYMVVPQSEEKKGESYCIKMLEAEGMEGILKLEQRCINNKVFYYYDITAKQAVNILLTKAALNYERVKQLFMDFIQTIEKAYEYLLNENDFVLVPEYIFMDMMSGQFFLCYLPGYQRDIREQITGFIEFVMNKLDYSDKEAVLLVYNLYAAAKEDGFIFDHLLELVQSQNILTEEVNCSHSGTYRSDKVLEDKGKTEKSRTEKHRPETGKAISGQDRLWTFGIESDGIESVKTSKHVSGNKGSEENIQRKLDKEIPVMMEQLTGEKEVPCYPLMTYIYTAICGISVVLIFFLSIQSGLIYNSLKTRIDYSKLSALLLILFCITGYLMKKIWDKKNKITKIVTNHEYIDPRKDLVQRRITEHSEALSAANEYQLEGTSYSESDTDDINIEESDKPLIQKANHVDEEEINPTCLLNATEEENIYLLKPMEESMYKTIRIENFPFFIGKLKKNVDYCLEKDVVSRYHAKITKEQDKIYITDLNSTNGTFINNQTLQSYQRKEIVPGDEIAFADIKYLFYHKDSE